MILPVVAAAALTLGLSACQSQTTGAAAGPVVAPPSVSASAAGSGDSSRADTPGAAVSAWVTQILEEKYAEACKASVAVAKPSTSCAGENQVIRTFQQLHTAWAKPGVALPPKAKVDVAKVDAKGDTATVPDTSIKVDGRTLHDLELIGATGNTSSFKLELKVQKKNAVWYVSDLNFSV